MTFFYNDDEKAVLATYANLAEHNLLLLLNDIAERVGVKTMDEEGNVQNHQVIGLLEPNKNPNSRQQQRVIHGLQRGFLFIQPLQRRMMAVQRMKNEKVAKQTAQTETLLPKHYYEYLQELTTLIHTIRNHLSHAQGSELNVTFNQDLYNGIFDAALRKIKARFNYDEKILEKYLLAPQHLQPPKNLKNHKTSKKHK